MQFLRKKLLLVNLQCNILPVLMLTYIYDSTTGQISQSESAMYYPTGKITQDYMDQSFTPHFEPPCDTNKMVRANELCGGNKFCLFDYCVLPEGDFFAQYTRETHTTFGANIAILGE